MQHEPSKKKQYYRTTCMRLLPITSLQRHHTVLPVTVSSGGALCVGATGCPGSGSEEEGVAVWSEMGSLFETPKGGI